MKIYRLLLISALVVLAGCAAKPTTKSTASISTSQHISSVNAPKDMWERIRRGYAMPDLDTELVDYWTDYYARNPNSVAIMSERASKYLYHIVETLERRNMPTELALLPFIESAYNPTAYSKSHASGLWQFIPSTGKDFNLHQDAWQDKRRDPIASTDAALDYFEYLYEFQGNWHLALASYNWGQGAVRRAMEKNERKGLASDYLSLTMPEETRNYVPKLQAIKNIITNPQKYGIRLSEVYNEPYFTTVTGNDHIDIAVAAELAEMSVDEFTFLNPSFKRDLIPAHSATLLLPKDKAHIFEANIKQYKGRLSKWDVYRPKSGESYATIAKRHGMTLSQLRSINGIGTKQAHAKSAQELLVSAAPPALKADPLGLQLAALSSSTESSAKPAAASVTRAQTARPAALRTHLVKRGDTLYSIARRYNTTVNTLQQLNKLKSTQLAPGARLRIPGTQRG